MQRILFPMQNLNITQKYGIGTHKQGFPIDNAGRDTGIESAFAPFDGVIKKVWVNGNSVWLESLEPVEYADGTKDYAVVMLTHDNDIRDLPVGKIIRQGEIFYQEGTAGNATGNHIHLEIGRGRFSGTGWQAIHNQWTINNAYRPENAFFIQDSTNVINTAGLNFKKYSAPKPPVVTPPSTGFKSAKGTATVIVDVLNVRNDPSTANAAVAKYTKGQSFNYDGFIIANGFVWLSYISWSGQRRYIAEGPSDGNKNNVYVRGGVSR